MVKNDRILTLKCGTTMTLISPGDCTLQCGMLHYITLYKIVFRVLRITRTATQHYNII